MNFKKGDLVFSRNRLLENIEITLTEDVKITSNMVSCKFNYRGLQMNNMFLSVNNLYKKN